MGLIERPPARRDARPRADAHQPVSPVTPVVPSVLVITSRREASAKVLVQPIAFMSWTPESYELVNHVDPVAERTDTSRRAPVTPSLTGQTQTPLSLGGPLGERAASKRGSRRAFRNAGRPAPHFQTPGARSRIGSARARRGDGKHKRSRAQTAHLDPAAVV